MRTIFLLCLVCTFSKLQAQTTEPKLPIGNIRLSFLIFPSFTILLTLEMRTLDKLTIQLETNFIKTHGVNLKYFISQRMDGHFVFVGNAFLESDFLRKEKNITFLPYAGYGYAYRFGKSKAWTFDSRLGIGRTINADNNLILPVLKTGIGRTF
ncbi:hypothetical protein GCM10009430_32310 [Aquimarina litoralis]|uniref:DUF3575 domain-containing protein n=1 Tax=Aquimarina litoralis TaxID=584605 RepID=A0ABP3UAE6_9FLAO